MTPAMCQTRHQPPTSYGDCLRACVATVMDVPCESVPHFADNGASAEDALWAARIWLLGEARMTIACFAYPGDATRDELLDYMGEMNPGVTWLLFGSTLDAQGHGGDHVNVCQGGKVVHDPNWIPTSIKGPTSAGIWQIWVITRV